MNMDQRAEQPDPPLADYAAKPAPGGLRGFLRRPALFPTLYTWYVFASALDLMLTWVILHHGGREANAVANWIIERHDLMGIVFFKFAIVMLVILICEIVGRVRYPTGLLLARCAVALGFFPVIIGTAEVVRLVLIEPLPPPV